MNAAPAAVTSFASGDDSSPSSTSSTRRQRRRRFTVLTHNIDKDSDPEDIKRMCSVLRQGFDESSLTPLGVAVAAGEQQQQRKETTTDKVESSSENYNGEKKTATKTEEHHPAEEEEVSSKSVPAEEQEQQQHPPPPPFLIDVICFQEVIPAFYDILVDPTVGLGSHYTCLPTTDDTLSGDLWHDVSKNVVHHINCIFFLKQSCDNNNNNNNKITSSVHHPQLVSLPRDAVKMAGSRVMGCMTVVKNTKNNKTDADEKKSNNDDDDIDEDDDFFSTVLVVNVHLLADTSKRIAEGKHQAAREEQLHSLTDFLHLEHEHEKHVVICGDFNFDEIEESPAMKSFFEQEELVDAQSKKTHGTTWKCKFNSLAGRLDRVYAHNLLVKRSVNFPLIATSDHCAVVAELEFKPPRWKVELEMVMPRGGGGGGGGDEVSPAKDATLPEKKEAEAQQAKQQQLDLGYYYYTMILYEGSDDKMVRSLLHAAKTQHQFVLTRTQEVRGDDAFVVEEHRQGEVDKNHQHRQQQHHRSPAPKKSSSSSSSSPTTARRKKEQKVFEKNLGNLKDHLHSVLTLTHPSSFSFSSSGGKQQHESPDDDGENNKTNNIPTCSQEIQRAFQELEEIGAGEISHLPLDTPLLVKTLVVTRLMESASSAGPSPVVSEGGKFSAIRTASSGEGGGSEAEGSARVSASGSNVDNASNNPAPLMRRCSSTAMMMSPTGPAAKCVDFVE